LAVEPWIPGKEYGPQDPFAALVVQVPAGVEVGGDEGGALDEGGIEAGVDGAGVVGLGGVGFVVGGVGLGVVGVEVGVVGSLPGVVGADVAGEVAVAGAEVCGAGLCGVDEPPGEDSRLCGWQPAAAVVMAAAAIVAAKMVRGRESLVMGDCLSVRLLGAHGTVTVQVDSGGSSVW
jgi:hypothetical protein